MDMDTFARIDLFYLYLYVCTRSGKHWNVCYVSHVLEGIQ